MGDRRERGDYRGQAAALQKACSNLEIMGKRIRASVDPNYSFSAKTRSAKKSEGLWTTFKEHFHL
jgi:hypothetical protein